MNISFNDRTGGYSHGWCGLVCKLTGKIISEVKKKLQDEGVDVFWYKKLWVQA